MKNRFVFASLSVVALLAVACGGGGATPAPATSSAATPAPTSAAASPAPTSSGDDGTGATVQVASTDLGEILVDGEGRTLYAFTPDESSGEPTCYDDCAANWPPLVTSGEVTVGEGLDDGDFTTVARTDDAGDQVKVGGWPLYYFAADTAAGDTNGQGVGGKWFVVDANGELIESD
jgi:predicted lipoprotein with Yx(FWY)xxD motif